jgi:hypothetical protein
MNLVAAGWHIEQFTMAKLRHYPFCHGLRDIKPDFLEMSRLGMICESRHRSRRLGTADLQIADFFACSTSLV